MQSRLIASLLAATPLAAGLMCAPARADDSEARLNALERQIRALQGELQHVRRDMAAHNEQVRALAKQSALAEARISHGGVETAARLEAWRWRGLSRRRRRSRNCRWAHSGWAG